MAGTPARVEHLLVRTAGALSLCLDGNFTVREEGPA